jgi:large subunit ribosomal protein L11
VFSDKSFTFITKTPPTSILLMKAAGADKGSAKPNRDKVGKLPMKTIKEIAQRKLQDLNTDDLEAAIRSVKGTARSMGIEVTE